MSLLYCQTLKAKFVELSWFKLGKLILFCLSLAVSRLNPQLMTKGAWESEEYSKSCPSQVYWGKLMRDWVVLRANSSLRLNNFLTWNVYGFFLPLRILSVLFKVDICIIDSHAVAWSTYENNYGTKLTILWRIKWKKRFTHRLTMTISLCEKVR